MTIYYAVMCERDTDQLPIVLIDDDRADGGRIRVESNQTDVKRGRASHRGGSVNVYGACGGPCRRRLDLSDATVAHLVDTISDKLHFLTTTAITEYERAADQDATEAWQAERHHEVLAELTGTGCAPARSDIPMEATSRVRYVIPFGVLCSLVTDMNKQR